MKILPKHSLTGWGVRLFWIPLLLTFSGCLPRASAQVRIDGKRAIEHAEAIVAHGPHPPGTNAQRLAGLYIIEQLEALNLQVETRTFNALTPLGSRKMVNIWGIAAGTAPGVLLICSHYDSKYFEDFTFVGANDGASSSGLVLELARAVQKHRPVDLSVWFVFFDGEEAFGPWTEIDSLYGSRDFARMLQSTNRTREIKAMLLLDLIGARDLAIQKDSMSTPWLNELIWRQAERLGHSNLFRPQGFVSAQDDHLPFLELGIPSVDLIDLAYAYWHTPEDTVDKLSAENLAAVGEVVFSSLAEIEEKVAK